MPEDDGVGEAFESVIIREAAKGSVIQAVAKMVAKKKKLLAPRTRFIAQQAMKEVGEAAQLSVLVALPSQSSLLGDPSSSEKNKDPCDTESRSNEKELQLSQSQMTR